MPQVTVATLNLKKAELRWRERAPVLLEQLAELRPDVIGLQEADLRIDQGNWLCAHLNEKLSGDRPYAVYHMVNPRENAPVEALAVMTRLPVLEHQGYDYLVRNRVAHRLRLDVGGVAVDFWNTHLHHLYDEEGHKLRVRQVQSLLGWIERDGGHGPSVLVGDFNAMPDSEPVRLLKQRLVSSHEAAHGREPLRTFWTPLANEVHGDQPPEGLAIDYVFVSPSARVIDACVVFDRHGPGDPTLYASDHYVLIARLEPQP